jgi:hypothetical protein
MSYSPPTNPFQRRRAETLPLPIPNPRRRSTYGSLISEDSQELLRPILPSWNNRRSTLSGIPPTFMTISEEDLQQNLHIQPTAFFYSEETFQEARYSSIEDIRPIENNECLWIDVTGVSLKRKSLFIYFNC